MLPKLVRSLLFCMGATLSCFTLVQDQMEIGRVSDYLQSSLTATSMPERQLLNGSEDNSNLRKQPTSVVHESSSKKNEIKLPYVAGGNSDPEKPTTLQLLVGDPEMMNRTIQAIALNPHHPGRLVAIVNVMNLNCTERIPYITSGSAIVGIHIGSTLLHSQPTNMGWTKDIHTTIEINIPLQGYDELKAKGNGVKVTVRDLIGGTDHTIPLLVDHSPKTFLSGLVWINKSRRYYEGRKEEIAKKKAVIQDFWKQNRAREDVGTRLGPVPRNDAYTLSHLLPWIQYHREQGVEHIYILDQENNLTQPNFPLTPPFLTYVRAPYAHMDYFVDLCDPRTNKLKSRARMAIVQHILDTLVIRMTPSEWMLVSDLDEFFVPAPDSGNLPKLIEEFSSLHCDGLPWKSHYKNPMWEQWQDLKCQKTNRPVYELQYYQVKFSKNNTIALSSDKDDYWALTKNIYHTPYTARTRVHFAYPLHDSAVSTKVLPHKGFLAHFRAGAPSGDKLKRMPIVADKLRRFSSLRLDTPDDDYVHDSGTAILHKTTFRQKRKRVKQAVTVGGQVLVPRRTPPPQPILDEDEDTKALLKEVDGLTRHASTSHIKKKRKKHRYHRQHFYNSDEDKPKTYISPSVVGTNIDLGYATAGKVPSEDMRQRENEGTASQKDSVEGNARDHLDSGESTYKAYYQAARRPLTPQQREAKLQQALRAAYSENEVAS